MTPYAILDNALLDNFDDAKEEVMYFKKHGGYPRTHHIANNRDVLCKERYIKIKWNHRWIRDMMAAKNRITP